MSTKAKPRFSIAALDPEVKANAGHEFEITDPETGEGTGMFISVVSKESTAYKQKFRTRVNQIRRTEAVNAGKPTKVRTIEDDIADSIDVLAACTTGWRNIVLNEGEPPLDFTPDNVRALYKYDFVRLQVDEEVMKVAGFTDS